MVMRAALRPVLLVSLAACAHEPAPTTLTPRTPDTTPTPVVEAAPPPQYVVADSASKEVVPLGKDGTGTVVDGLRVIVSGTGMRVAKELADPPLVAGMKLPAWMGPGFLFRSSTSLYLADSFDGPLKPVASFPAEIDDVRLGPKFALVLSSSGQRWPVDLKTGQRVPANPVGVTDIAGGPDGRAAALAEFGGVFVSGDGGTKWSDVASQLQGAVEELRVTEDGEIWLVTDNGPSARIDAGGHLALVDKAPDVKPATLRAKDPRWKSSDAPIRRALASGIADGERIALVVVDGSVARVDVGTGQVLSYAQGRLPPDATCEAVRAPDDVVFACARRNGTSFVASHVLSDKAPIIEQSFAQPGTFYTGDDGGLAYGGAGCTGKTSPSTVCVRNSGGAWQEYDLDPTADGGGGGSVDVSRWIPRADGAVWALTTGSSGGLWDVRSGSFHPFAGDPMTSPSSGRHYYKRGYYTGARDGRAVDRMWTATPAGTLRGWADNGLTSFELRLDGTVSASPFTFEQAQTSGAYAFARAQGRTWQSTDRGVTWAEVEAPPVGLKADVDVRACSMLGCDLGKWYRIGWSATAPTPRADPVIARSPARVASAATPMLACKTVGLPTTSAITRSNNSPEDLGLGAQKLPASSDETTYARQIFGRGPINPAHGEEGSVDREDGALRMVVHGYQTDSGNGSHFTVAGPVKDPLALRRSTSYVAAFDPTAVARRTSFGIAELVAAARTIGMTSSDVLNDDPSMPNATALLLAQDPTAPADVLWTSELGMVGATRALRTKVTMRPQPQDTQWVASGAWTGPDEIVLLELDGAGQSHVSRWTGNGILSIFDVPAPPRPELYPANPDAIAIGPKNEVALLRTPSGDEPPTDSSPALLYQHGQPPTPLAAWSTLLPADDPACKSDASGFRAIVHTVKPWVRVPAELAQPEARMLARVKWSTTRVCLEAVEVRTPDVRVNVMQRGDDPNDKTYSTPINVETWTVARFVGGAAAVRAGVVPGFEWRQGMSCALTP